MRIINTHSEAVPPDNPMTAEEIVDLCCEEVPFDPCANVGRVSPYTGAEMEDWNFDPAEELAKAQADNPRIISVSTEGIGNRPGEPCGKKYESWEGKNNCCDLVEPMSWDDENSAEVIEPGSRVIVGITGGKPPFYVSVRGEGFTLDGYRIRDGWTDTRLFWVYATGFACGWCPITVSDGCSEVRGGLRSTLGEWVALYQDLWNTTGLPISLCPFSMSNDDFIPSDGGSPYWEKTSGKYKLSQTSAIQQCGFSCVYPDVSSCFHVNCTPNPYPDRRESIVANFADVVPHSSTSYSDWFYDSEYCFWEKLYAGGWPCTMTHVASHVRKLYEWRC